MQFKLHHRCLGHTSGVYDLIKLSDKSFLSASGDRLVVSWNIDQPEQGNLIARASISTMKLRSVFFDEELNKIFVGCGEGMFYVFDDDTMEVNYCNQLSKQGFSVNAIIHYTDDILLCGGRDAHLRWVDKKDYSVVNAIPAHNYAIYKIGFSLDRKLFATASRDKTLKIWDANTNQVIQRIEHSNDGHLNSVNTLLWIDDNTLISAGDDRSINIWKKD